MRSLVLLTAFVYAPFFMLLNAQLLPSIPFQQKASVVQQQGAKLDTAEDLKKFLFDMKSASSMGNYSASYTLGLFYTNSHFLKDGTSVEADIQKATHYYDIALEQGSVLAGHALAVFYLKDERPQKSLSVIKQALDIEGGNISAKNYLSNMYATIVLDKFPTDKKALGKAIEIYKQNDGTLSVATSQYLMANLYNLSGDPYKANYYLTKACTNPKITKELKNICYGGSVEVIDNNTTARADLDEKPCDCGLAR